MHTNEPDPCFNCHDEGQCQLFICMLFVSRCIDCIGIQGYNKISVMYDQKYFLDCCNQAINLNSLMVFVSVESFTCMKSVIKCKK